MSDRATTILSVNEPHTSRQSFTPVSINEPRGLPSAEAPTLVTINPNTAVIGGPDLTMTVKGTGFSPGTAITFNGGEENTVFVDTKTLTTIVKPSTATTPGTYPVTVVNSAGESEPAGFTFTDTVTRTRSASEVVEDIDPSDPDELEDEIEQAEEEGEFKSTHPKPKAKKK
jgi:hypothetical protein